MRRRPPSSTLTDPLFPPTTLFRSIVPLQHQPLVARDRRAGNKIERRDHFSHGIGQRHQCPAAADGLGDPAYQLLEAVDARRSEEHTSELQSLMRISYAVFCLKQKRNTTQTLNSPQNKINTAL